MRRFPFAFFLMAIAGSASFGVSQDGPQTHPSLTTKLEGEALFWQAEPVKLRALKPANPKLISKPNLKIDYAVVHVDDLDPEHFLDSSNSEAWAPYLDKTSPTY